MYCYVLCVSPARLCSKRAFIVTDPPLFEMGICTPIIEKLISLGIQPKAFSQVEPDPTLGMVEKAMDQLRSFKPDLIIAVGGGSPMDAAKLMWLMYEHPETKFEEVAARFMVSWRGSQLLLLLVVCAVAHTCIPAGLPLVVCGRYSSVTAGCNWLLLHCLQDMTC